MKKLFLSLSLMLAGAGFTKAQVIYHDIAPDSTVDTWNAYSIAPISNNDNFTLWWHPTPEVVVETWGNCQLLFDASGNYPAKLDAGTIINATGMWKAANYHALNSSGTGNWRTDNTGKYLAFRIKNRNGAWDYGWLKMSVASNASSFTVQEWAYNSAGSAITAGAAGNTEIIQPARHNPVSMSNNGKQLVFKGLENDTKYQLGIFDMNGRKLMTSSVGSADATDLQSLPSGVYLVDLQGAGFACHFKLALQ